MATQTQTHIIDSLCLGSTLYNNVYSDNYILSIPFGTSSTGGGTQTKLVNDLDAFALEHGAQVLVKFDYANTAESPKLNVNNTGAKFIYWQGHLLNKNKFWDSGSVLHLVYYAPDEEHTWWELINVVTDNKVSTVNWESVEDKPFIRMGGDTLSWNAATQGIEGISPESIVYHNSVTDGTPSIYLFKVCHEIPTRDELQTEGSRIYFNGDWYTLMSFEIGTKDTVKINGIDPTTEQSDAIIPFGHPYEADKRRRIGYVIKYANTTLQSYSQAQSYEFKEPGIYFHDFSYYSEFPDKLISINIPGYEKFPPYSYKINKECLPTGLGLNTSTDDLTGTVWKFGDTLNNIPGTDSYNINFVSCGVSHSSLHLETIEDGGNDSYIFMSYDKAGDANYTVAYSHTWTSLHKDIQTITIGGGADATNPELINWLYLHATLLSIDLSNYQHKSDSTLTTSSKAIVGAINELNQTVTNITSLANKTYKITNGWAVSAGFGNFSVDYDITVNNPYSGIQSYSGNTELYLGYTAPETGSDLGGRPTFNLPMMQANSIYCKDCGYTLSDYEFVISFKGGVDTANKNLIDWLNTYGELLSSIDPYFLQEAINEVNNKIPNEQDLQSYIESAVATAIDNNIGDIISALDSIIEQTSSIIGSNTQ
jgi:hypothetical protein